MTTRSNTRTNAPTTRTSQPLTALVIAAAAAALLSACTRQPASPKAGAPQAPAEVRLTPVVRKSVDRTIPVTGTLHGREEATLASKVSGRVSQIVRDVGDHAPSGEVVVQIDPTDYELALTERKAALRASLAKLGLEEPPGSGFDLAKVPTVERAKAEAANAGAKLRRTRELFEQDPPLVSEQEFADARTSAEVADRSAEVELLNAGAALAESRTQAAMVQVAAQRLADTAVRSPAPASGSAIPYRVSERLVSLGELVSIGQPVARVVAADIIKFRAKVPEKFSGRIAIGQSAAVTVDAHPTPFPGRVTRLAPRADERSRTFEVEIEIDNTDGRLKPGGFARGAIVVGSEENIPHVPADAVVTFAGVKRVFSVRDGKAVEHRVTTADAAGGLVEIVGQFPVDAVVASGGGKLAAGQPVVVGADR